FFGACRPPGRLNAANHVAKTIKRFPSTNATYFHVVGLRVRRPGRIRCGQADNEKRVLGTLRGLGQSLREAKLRLEPPGRKSGSIMKLARVSDPLIDHDEARTVEIHEFAQRVAGTGCLLVIGGDTRKCLLRLRNSACRESKLPSEFAPQRAHDGSVRLLDR